MITFTKPTTPRRIFRRTRGSCVHDYAVENRDSDSPGLICSECSAAISKQAEPNYDEMFASIRFKTPPTTPRKRRTL